MREGNPRFTSLPCRRVTTPVWGGVVAPAAQDKSLEKDKKVVSRVAMRV